MGIRRWLRELTASVEELEVLHAVRDTPSIAIGELAEGELGCITGTVFALDDRRLTAPLTGRRCLGWGVKIAGGGFATTQRDFVPFGLTEHDRRAIIDAKYARTLITATHFSKCRGLSNADDAQSELLRAIGATEETFATFAFQTYFPTSPKQSPPMFRFAEWIIESRAVLAVVGGGIREPDRLAADGDYRERPTLIRITGTAEQPILFTDELAAITAD